MKRNWWFIGVSCFIALILLLPSIVPTGSVEIENRISSGNTVTIYILPYTEETHRLLAYLSVAPLVVTVDKYLAQIEANEHTDIKADPQLRAAKDEYAKLRFKVAAEEPNRQLQILPGKTVSSSQTRGKYIMFVDLNKTMIQYDFFTLSAFETKKFTVDDSQSLK